MDYLQRAPAISVATTIDHDRVAQARYPQLFDVASFPSRPGVERVARVGTGLVAVIAVHECLTPEEQRAISEYRLHQYVLAGLYDAEKVARLGLEVDPAVAMLAPRDIHVAIGDSEGRFLSYVCMQSPIGGKEWVAQRDGPSTRCPLMGDSDRLEFPTESEYGMDIYGKHPGLRMLPVANVREFMRLVRNQAIRVPADLFATAEVMVAVSKVILDPEHQIEALVGAGSPQVRKMLYGFGIPVAYAPTAPIVGDNLSGEVGDEILWTNESHRPGRFWPLILSTPDAQRDADFYHEADRVLALPLDELAQELNALRAVELRRQPRHALDAREYGSVLWTGDPFYTEPEPKERAAAAITSRALPA